MKLHRIDLDINKKYCLETNMSSIVQGKYLGQCGEYIMIGNEDCPQLIYITEIHRIREVTSFIGSDELKKGLEEN